MSEAITKRCDNCGGAGWSRGFICGPCDGSGRVADVEATLRAEVARLKEELSDTKSTLVYIKSRLDCRIASDDHARASVTRLTAEVERLKGREAFARPFVERNDVDSDGDETCPECGNYVRFTSGSEHECPPTCPRAAWIAGCKS